MRSECCYTGQAFDHQVDAYQLTPHLQQDYQMLVLHTYLLRTHSAA